MRKINLLNTSTLLAYIALIGSVSSIATEVHYVPLLIFVLSLLSGLFLDKRSAPGPHLNPLILLGLVILGIIISLISLDEKNIFNRALGILLIIISAKLVSPKKPRDMLQIFLLNFFMVTGSAVTRLDLEFGLLVLGEAFITILGLLLIHGSNEQQEIPAYQVWQLARWSSVITICLIPATVIIFLIIPRPTMTLFAWERGMVSRTGFSDSVTPGAVEKIKVDSSPAFRVKWIKGKRPEKILWRGIVYDTYNLGTWERKDHPETTVPAIRAESVQYEVILEPTNSRYLLSIGLPYIIQAKGRKTSITSGYTIETDEVIDHRTIYMVHSHLLKDLPADSPTEIFLETPYGIRKDLALLTTGLIKDSDFMTAEAVEIFLKGRFSYDLLPGKPSGDPILYFLTTSKKGHCEYFASAMVLLLRYMGIPARIVGGYLGGEWNDLGQYYLVRQSDAHTWVEAWIEGRDWVTFDPTPASPLADRSPGRIFRFIDMLRLKWYYWVLDYNINRQLDLARKGSAALKSFRFRDNRFSLIRKASSLKYFIVFVLMIGLAVLFRVTSRYLQERPKSYGERFLYLLKKHGYNKTPGETLLELVEKIPSDKPGLENSAKEFVKGYYLFEYDHKGSERILSLLLKNVEEEIKMAGTSL
ncbi:transglutaminaseTgpA domain-containing protein [Thermodesulfobacteriota bacterium]